MKYKAEFSTFYASFLSISMLFSGVPRVHTHGGTCAAGEFMVLNRNVDSFRCQSCYMCPPGYGVKQECGPTSDTVCTRCPEDHFSDSSTREGGCQRCRPCMDMEDTIRECTPNSDRVCREECSNGEYLDVPSRRCLPCSLCHRENDVRVFPNEQCSNQGMPATWSCASNITIIDDDGNIVNTLDTGDTYSYRAVILRRQNAGYRGDHIPPLDEYISRRMMSAPTPRTVEPTQVSNSESVTDFTTNQVVTSDSVSTIAYFLRGFPTTNSLLDAIKAKQCDDGFPVANTIYWFVSLSYVFFILVITAMSLILYEYHKDYRAMHGCHSDLRRLAEKQTPPEHFQTWPISPTGHSLRQPPPYDSTGSREDELSTYFLNGIVTPV